MSGVCKVEALGGHKRFVFYTNDHECTTNFHKFLASVGAHRFIGRGSHTIFHRQGFTPAGVHTACLMCCHLYEVSPCVPTQSLVETAYQ